MYYYINRLEQHVQPPIVILLADLCSSNHSVVTESDRVTPIPDLEEKEQLLSELLLQNSWVTLKPLFRFHLCFFSLVWNTVLS